MYQFSNNEPASSELLEHRAKMRKLVSKWKFLLEGKNLGLEPLDTRVWEPMAMLFENQQRYINQQRHPLLETTQTSDVVLPERYALPLIRLIFPELFILKICSVQPMPMDSGGTGRIFWQDFLRTDAALASVTVPDSDYAAGTEGSVPKRLKMTITSTTLEATKQILAATWSTEVMEDARGAMGLDIESELVSQMGNEIRREIEQMVINEIVDNATAGNVNWDVAEPEGWVGLPKDWYETIFHAFIDAEDLIFTQRYRKADYIVAGREITKVIRKAADFVPAPSANAANNPFPIGVELVGKLSGLWDVYTSVYMTTTKALMGYYPRSVTDCGYVYAPYIPLAAMPLVYAEMKAYNDATMPGAYVNTDMWTRNVRMRHGRKMVVPTAFATVTMLDTSEE